MAFVTIGTGATGTGTTATLLAPASIVNNNILTAVLFTQFTGRTITPPAGWTAIASATKTKTFINRDQNAYQISSFWKLAASESGNYAFGISTSSGWLGFITQHSGRNTTSPITAGNSTDANGVTGTNETYNLNGVTAAASDDLLWFASGNAGLGTAVFTPPTGFATRSANALSAGGAAIYLATKDAVSAGATGTLSGSEAGMSCDIGGVVIAIAASGGATATALPSVGAVTEAGLAPTLLKEKLIAPNVGAVTLAGVVVTVLDERQIGPNVGSIQTLGLAPTLITERLITPSVGAITVSGLAPTYANEQTVQPDISSLLIQGLVPTLDTTTTDPSLGRGHVGTGRRWHGRIGKYEGTESYSVAVSEVFPTEAEPVAQPFGALPAFKPLDAFPVGVPRPPYVIPAELLAQSQARVAKTKRRRRDEELILLNLL